MSTLSSDSPEISKINLNSLGISVVCHLCEKQIKHADVVMLGLSSEDEPITVHPVCLSAGKNPKIKGLDRIHVFIEAGRNVSPAKLLIVKKRMKEIYKAIAIANERRKQEEAAK